MHDPASELRRTRHRRRSGFVKLHSLVTTLGQQRTEAEPGRLGVFGLTRQDVDLRHAA
jgi:hypothetical protein